MTTSLVLQSFFAGLTTGSIYAVLAVGFVIIMSASNVINLAQGEFVILGILIMVSLTSTLGLNYGLAMVLTVVLVMIIAGMVELLTVHPFKEGAELSKIIATVAVAMIIRSIAAMIWGTDPYSLPTFVDGQPLALGGATITIQSLFTIGFALVSFVLLSLFFRKSSTGRAFRAVVINRMAARLVGVTPGRMALLSFGISGALGALGGIFIGPIIMAKYDSGVMLSLKGFVSAILGGMSVPGSVLGGFLLGMSESLVAGLVSSRLKDVMAFVILLLVLFLKPEGLLGLRKRGV